MSNLAHDLDPDGPRLPFSAAGSVRAIEAGLVGTFVGGALSGLVALGSGPLALVVALPVVVSAICAVLGYRSGAKNKP